MFENLYTTKMSMNKKKLQNRFSKIRSVNAKIHCEATWPRNVFYGK